MAVAAENGATSGRIVVVGDADFLNNINLYSGGNSIFFTNALNWLARDELTLELTPRETVDRTLNMTSEQITTMQLLGLCIGPLLVAGAGLLVWRQRRQRR